MQNKGIKNAILNANCGIGAGLSNSPNNADTQRQLFGRATQMFYTKQLKFASNRVIAEVQGLDYSDFYAYQKRYIRTSDVQIATTGEKLNADWQYVIVEGVGINFLPRGAKIRFNGNTWLVTNPLTIQGINCCGIMCRCDSTWNHYDADGNLKKEPFHFGNGGNALGSDNFITHNSILMDSYTHSYIQLNEETKAIHHNTRMVVGSQVFTAQGLQDGYQEFTDDENSIHLMHFDLHVTETLDIDDMINRVAGGLAQTETGMVINPERKNPDSEGWTGKRIAILTDIPEYLPVYSTLNIGFAVYNGEEEVNDSELGKLGIDFRGANGCYTHSYSEETKTLSITATEDCVDAITITVSCDGCENVQIRLRIIGR